MEVRLLGLVEAGVDGRAVELGGVKQRAVLAMLALRANSVVSVDQLIEGLWGEQPPRSAAKMVQGYVSQLRKLLDGHETGIVTRGRGYELRLPEDLIDALRFERLVTAAERSEGASRGAAREALSLWRGPPLDDLADEPFAAAEIRRLQELRLRARELALWPSPRRCCAPGRPTRRPRSTPSPPWQRAPDAIGVATRRRDPRSPPLLG